MIKSYSNESPMNYLNVNSLSLTNAYKPHTNLSICPGVHQWLCEQLEAKLDIVIGGCTITSCVRDSSIHMKKMFPQLNIFVDRNLCGS